MISFVATAFWQFRDGTSGADQEVGEEATYFCRRGKCRMERARFLAATLSAAAVLAPPRLAAQELTTVRVTAVPNDDLSPLLYAQQSGLFRRVGLDIQLQPATSGAAIAAALAGGSFDIGLVSMMGQLTGHVRGVPFTMIAPSLLYLTDEPAALLLVLKDSPVRSVRDLAGKVISASAIRDVSWVALRALVDQSGIDSATLKFVELPQTAVAAAIEQKRVDAGTLLNPNLEEALATGHFRSVAKPLDGIARRWMVASYCTMADYATKNRDIVERFATVMRTATVFANTHHAETAPMIAAFSGIELAHVLAMKRVTCAEYLDPRDIQPTIEAAVKYKVFEKSFPAQEMISPYALKPPR